MGFAGEIVLYFAEFVYYFFVDFGVGGEDIFAEEVELFAVGVGDAAAGFFDDECASCDVPGF